MSVSAEMRTTRPRAAVIAGLVFATAVAHVVMPAGPHGWHPVHLAAQKLYYVPIVLAAAWFGSGAAAAAATAVTLFSAAHLVREWAGQPMLQADQAAEIVTYWLVALLAGALFERERRALATVRGAHEETLDALAGSLELREPYTAGHSRRVSALALRIAERMGIGDAAFLRSLAWGGLLHDVGKIGMPDRILLKQGPLDGTEWRQMRRHPELGARLIGDIGFLRGARELVLSHHERFDGSGYPRALVGEAIPLGARIFAVADAFDALTTTRPYRAALPARDAAARVAEGRGTHFDPAVVDAFLSVPPEAWTDPLPSSKAPPGESAAEPRAFPPAAPTPQPLRRRRGNARSLRW